MEKRNEEKSEQIKKLLDFLSMEIGTSNISRTTAKSQSKCCKCGGDASVFKDELSKREYKLTGWCQTCQDDFFGG